MANKRFIDFPIATTVGDNDIILIWQGGANKQTTKATILSGVPDSLNDLTDVTISGLTNGQILRYDSVSGQWENTDQGNLDLNDLNDVTIVSPTNGQVLVYNSSTGKWENSSGGYVPYVGAVTTVNLGAQTIQAGSFVKQGGTASQFLKADGSIDSTAYGTGSVTSVGLTMPAAFSVAGSPITTAGTLAVTGAGTVAQYIRGDGSLADFPESSGGGSSVSYYLNGSVDQGTIGGVAYKELNKVPILGAGTQFSISADGYIASFITDAGDPNLIEIPGGNWNFETYFSASSGGGSPTFYVELYKVNAGGTATLIASSSSAPELIAFGTNLTPYFSSLAVPTTTLALTDRLAVRYYVTHSGRTITLHTENNTLCQIITTFTTGLTALNGLTAQVQNFAVGTTGTDFNIASAVSTHTFNLPTASATNRGALSSADWALFTQAYNDKINSAAVTGTTTKTLTLTQQDGGTITASWSDLNTDAVLSVFGRTGNVIAVSGDYTTAQVTESGNLYYTDARSRAALSFAAGSGAYNTSTGVITIPTNNNQITNGAGYITSAALSGYVQGSGTTNYLPKFTGTSTIGNSLVFDSGSDIRINTASNINATFGVAKSLGRDIANFTNVTDADLTITTSESGAAIKFARITPSVSGQPIQLGVNNNNVLIGTTSDNGARLQVSGGDLTVRKNSSLTNPESDIGFYNSFINTNSTVGTASAISLGSNSNFGVVIYGQLVNNSTNEHLLGFQTRNSSGNGGTRMVITGSGSVGIGTPSPSALLHLVQNTSNLNLYLQNTNGSGKTWALNSDLNGSFNIHDTTANRLTISTTGAATFSSSLTVNTTATIKSFLFLGESLVENGVINSPEGIYINADSDASGGTNDIVFGKGRTSTSGGTTFMTIKNSGNLGLGVTPSAWNSAYKAFQFGTTGALFGESGDAANYFTTNTFVDAVGFKYITSDWAIGYFQENGVHSWRTAPSGTAGNAISFTQAMTLFSTGNLLVGTPSPISDNGARLQVNGAGTFSSSVTASGSGSFMQADFFQTGSTPATSGGIRLGTQVAIRARNVANTGNIPLIESTASDGVSVSNGTLILSSSGAATFTSTVRINADGQSLLIFPTTTNSVRMQIQSTGGGNLVLGTENSSGGNLATGANAYASVFTSGSTRDLVLGTNSTARLTINGSSGTVTVNNLSGSGNRIVVANSGGTLISAVIGSGLAFDGTTLTATGGGSGSISGSGTSGIIPVFTGATSIGNSIITQSGGDIRIQTSADYGATLSVNKVAGRNIANFSNGADADLNFNISDTGAASKFARITPSVSGQPLQLGLNNNNILIGTTSDNGNRLRVNGTIFSDSSVTATSFFESSDASLKTLVEDNYQAKGIDSVVAKLYIKNGKEELGYYAQDLQGVLPSAVSKGSDGLLNLSYREVHTAKIAYLEEEIRQIKKRYEIN